MEADPGSGPSDEELMRRLCDSGVSAAHDELFGEIFLRYQSRVTSWCGRLTRNPDAAPDLAQEVFFKAHRYRHGFRGDARFSTWLYAIARNHCLTSLRKKASDPAELGESVASVHDLPIRDLMAREQDREIEHEQLRRKMWQLMRSTLDPMEARVMVMHYGHEVPMAVITQRLALSNPSGAKAYVVNARRKLSLVLRRRR